MNNPLLILMSAVLMGITSVNTAVASECELPVGVECNIDNPEIPANVSSVLCKRLESMLGATGMVSVYVEPAFVIKCSVIDVSNGYLPGPPKQVTVSVSILLQLCDNASGTVVSSCMMDDLKGVGNSLQQAFGGALRVMTPGNQKCRSFFDNASRSIENYYNKQYPTLMARAKTLASQQKFSEALYWLASIPECCQGYEETSSLATDIYKESIDRDGEMALRMARSIWAASPNAEGASRALPILLTIPSGSDAWEEADSLTEEIFAEVKDDKSFENRTKYTDSIRLEEMRIKAAHEIGTAWGNGQQPQNTNMIIR